MKQMPNMHCYKIELNTMSDVRDFIEISSQYEGLLLSDNDCYTINASSIMGVIYSLEWNNLYLLSEEDVYSAFAKFIIETYVRS